MTPSRPFAARTASLVVAAARRKGNPLNPCFTWDDAKAADQHRLRQARDLLRSCVITVETKEKDFLTRAYVAVEVGRDERDYQPVAVALRDHREQVLEKAMSELTAWRQRYAELEDLADLFAVVDETIEARAGVPAG